MANTCSIIRNGKTGEIEKVLAPNGQESILWQNLMAVGEFSVDRENALRTWAVAYTDGFKKEFGDWELFQKARELSGSIEKAFYRDLFEKEPEQFLFEMAQQLRSSDIEAQAARNVMGNDLAQIALQLFPNSIVGSKYTPQFTGKVDSNGEPLLQYVAPSSQVNYSFKVVDEISKNIKTVNRWYATIGDNDLFWDKLQTDLQIPKSQVLLLKDSTGNTIDEKLASFLSNYSYSVEINTSVSKKRQTYDSEIGEVGEVIGFEYETPVPTRYYHNITVPGGTNYTENEIRTPVITPSIRGHAQFATDKGIGWFRSDDRQQFTTFDRQSDENRNFELNGDLYEEKGGDGLNILDKVYKNGKEISYSEYEKASLEKQNQNIVSPKTRRILEVQSDLFQTSKNNFVLGSNQYSIKKEGNENIYELMRGGSPPIKISKEKYFEAYEAYLDAGGLVATSKVSGKPSNDTIQKEKDGTYSIYNKEIGLIQAGFLTIEKAKKWLGFTQSEGNFLSLLQRNNNWVTFFVKSIIQDSARKGYDRVLFPTGDTASKVEGHDTLEGFKRQKEARLKTLEESKVTVEKAESSFLDNKHNVFNYILLRKSTVKERFKTRDEAEKAAYNINNPIELEINQIKRELERVEKEGFDVLRPIYKFYETDVANILKKQGYRPERVRDEYGNGWYEISITPELARGPILFNRKSDNYKEVLSPDNQKIFEELIAKGLITERRWNGMYFVPKQYREPFRRPPFSYLKKDFRDGHFLDKNKYEELKAIIEVRGLSWLDVRPSNSGDSYVVRIFPTRQESMQTRLHEFAGKDAFIKIADRLSNRLGVPYKIIDAEQALKITEDSQIPWNGEGAFAYKGTVYVLQEALSLENAVHEFSHFFIEAVSKESPYLFSKLYKQLKDDPYTRERYLDLVERLYPDLSEEDKVKEVMVRALTDKALGLIDERGNVILEAIRKIFRTLANIIRTLFGVSVKNLNENTTLDQLAAILLGENDGEVLDLGDRNTGFFMNLFPMFNRDIANQLEKLTGSTVKSSIDSFFTVTDAHYQRLRQDKDLEKLKEILSNQKGTTLVSDERQILMRAADFARTLEENMKVDRAALITFAEAIEGQEVIAKKMADHVASVVTDKDMSTQEKLAIFRKYSFITKEWTTVVDLFMKAIKDSPVGRGRNPLSDSIQNMISDYKFIDNKIKDFYKEDGLPSLFREEIEGNIYYQAAMKEQEDRIKELEEAYKKDKNPAIKKKLDKERGLLERYKLTDETLAKYLSGEMGDTNHYSMYLESYTSNPDPIVGHFANWFMKHKFRAQSRAQQRMTAFENKISKIYKKLGYKPKDFQKVSENLVQIETFFDGYRNFKGEERKAWTFINQYGDDANGVGWQFEYNRLLQERESAKQRMHSPLRAPGYENMTGEEEYRRKNQAFEQFKLDYMFDEEADVIKEARLFWFRDANTHKAKMRREEVLNEIRALDYKDFSKDEALEKVTQSKALWRKYRQLGSIYDEMGNKKEGDELEIALTIREYNEKYGNLYEYVEISGAFESNLKSHEQQVADDLVSSGNYKTEVEAKSSPEFRAAIQKWYRDNIRITLTETFYKERSDIAERLKAFSESLGDQKIKKNLEEVSEAWSEINRIIQGNRDDDRQPIGTDLSDEQRKRVLELQQKVMDLNSAFNQANNLSDEEDVEYGQYVLKNKVFFMELTEQEYARMKELEEKAGIKLTKDQYLEKKKIFDDLNALQSKIATPYYVDTVNDFLAASGSELRITPLSADELLTAEVIQPILRKNPEFRKWWNENHLEKQIYDKTVDAVVLKYTRSYVWNRNVPNDEMFKTLLDNGDYEGLSRYKSPYLEVKPAQEYFYRRLKPEFRHFQSRETLWITHDNRGNWLPKPTEATATPAQKEYMLKHKIPFAKPRFENKKYLDLRENKKDEFELLEAFKQFHLESQQDLARYARLGLEVPRLRKNSVENVDLSKLADKPKDWWNNIKGWLGAMFMKRQDDYELGTGSYIAPANRAQTYVLSDLMGDQINSIPIKYMSHVETDLVSMDIGKAVEMYAVSAETNKVLHEINPMANALKEVLSDPENKPKDLTKKRRNIIKIITDPLKGSTNNNANKKGNYNRLKIIENFLERELEGEVNIQQFGPFIEKIAHGLMKIGAWGSLGGNIFAALKNAVGGQIQNNLESVMGQKFTPKTMMQADLEFGKLMVDLMRDYYQIGDKSLYTQMFILFDPLNFFTQKAGSNFSKTVTRDALDLRWIMGMQKFGEINIQGSAWLAMMLHQKVAFTDPHSGVQKEIPYIEAWELKDGVLSLKKGVDSKWDRGNSNFLQFSASVHKVNELNQGAYSEESQPEINRYTLGKLFLFMRKFYIPASVNRFAPKRYNAGLGSFRQGYWMPLFEMIKNTATGHPLMPGTDDFKVMYSASERAAALRAASELATIALIGLMIKALGFNDSDDEKYDKLKDNDWFHNFAIYQLMLIKSEAETFIPLFGMGINETVRFLGTPTIAFNTARRWVKLANDFVLWTIGSDAAFYQQASGIYDEGQIKYLADLYNIIGWKNFAYITSNEDLQKGIVMYSAMQKRI